MEGTPSSRSLRILHFSPGSFLATDQQQHAVPRQLIIVSVGFVVTPPQHRFPYAAATAPCCCRLAMPFTVVVLSQIVSGLVAAPLAAGLMSLDGTAGLHGW